MHPRLPGPPAPWPSTRAWRASPVRLDQAEEGRRPDRHEQRPHQRRRRRAPRQCVRTTVRWLKLAAMSPAMAPAHHRTARRAILGRLGVFGGRSGNPVTMAQRPRRGPPRRQRDGQLRRRPGSCPCPAPGPDVHGRHPRRPATASASFPALVASPAAACPATAAHVGRCCTGSRLLPGFGEPIQPCKHARSERQVAEPPSGPSREAQATTIRPGAAPLCPAPHTAPPRRPPT